MHDMTLSMNASAAAAQVLHQWLRYTAILSFLFATSSQVF